MNDKKCAHIIMVRAQPQPFWLCHVRAHSHLHADIHQHFAKWSNPCTEVCACYYAFLRYPSG